MKIYDYAEWSFRQEGTQICNAAVVAFYEHLVDKPATQKEIHKWVSYDIFEYVSDLLEFRSDAAIVDMIRKRYKITHKKRLEILRKDA